MAHLSQLLAHPTLGLTLIQAGPGDPVISWSSTTELLDLSEYLDGGEVILTTGLALAYDDPRWRDVVAALNRARVAAIGFGVGVNHTQVPPPLIAAASLYRVALFAIPLPTPFIAVTKAVAELIRTDELSAARSALHTQQRLLAGAHSDQDPADVLASISQATGKHLALLDATGGLLASTAGFALASRDAEVETVALDQGHTQQLAIAGAAPLTPEGRAVIAAGSMILGLGLRSERAAEHRERDRWERLTHGLLTDQFSADAIQLLDPAFPIPGRVRVLAVQGGAESLAEWRRQHRPRSERLLGRGVSPAAGISQAWQICADEPAALNRALAHAAQHDLDVVVGRPAPLNEVSQSRRSAEPRLGSLSTIAPLYAAPRVPEVIWADRDAPLLEALLSADHTGEGFTPHTRTRLSARVLGPLSLTPSIPAPDGAGSVTEAEPKIPSKEVQTEALNATDRALLRATLHAVFTADGQRGPAAAALGIHRNTLRDRITRIERLTARSLSEADDRAELWLALRMEDLAGDRPAQ